MAEKLVPINGTTAWTVRGLELIGSIVAAVLAAYIFIDARYDDIEKRLTGIEANRFTASDGRDVYKALANIENSLARMPSEVPPAWFLEKVDGIEKRVRKLEDGQ